MGEARYVSIQSRGLLALPAGIRRRYRLDEPGAQVEVIDRDGVIELRPKASVPADQVWFWSERWQAMEAEANADIEAGRVDRFDDAEAFLEDLDQTPSG